VAPSNRLISFLVRDWMVSGILNIRSGFYFGVVEASNRLNGFSPRQRSNVIGDWNISEDRDKSQMIQQYFNTAAFAFPGAGIAGNTARSFMAGPGSINLDSAVQRNIAMGERLRFQIRGEAYNTLNRANFNLSHARS
jgi:hypothetical protein